MELEKLHEDILKCRECTKKFGYLPNPIFQGKANSLIMQISQAPSKNVYNTSKPWNDASGKKINK